MSTSNATDARRDWGPVIVWVGLVLATILTAVVTSVVDVLVYFGNSSTCGDAPTPSQVHHGQLVLLVVLVVAVVPWALGFAFAPRRTPVLVCGLVAVVPALLFLLNGVSNDAWVGSFCW